jgi:hypothetical protein
MAVARTNAQGEWAMLGLLTFLDPPRPDTRATLETALKHGVQTRMVRLLWLPRCPVLYLAILGQKEASRAMGCL